MRELRPHQASNQILASQSQTGTASETLEEWCPVVGYEGSYEVSNLGRVRGLDRKVPRLTRWGTVAPYTQRGCVLVPCLNAKGYYTVNLWTGGECTSRTVHSLVAEAFIGPRPEGLETAHNDGDSRNNQVENLRYTTAADNSADRIRHGTQVRGSAVGNSKLSEQSVRGILALRGKETHQKIADQFGVSRSSVSMIFSGRNWRHLA